jgi:hypothetical protein
MRIGADIHLYLGTVVAPTPYLNSYLVDIKGVGRVISVSGEEGSGDRRGSTGGPTGYLPGTTVLIASPQENTENALGQDMPNVIVTAFAFHPKIAQTEFIPQAGIENPSDFNESRLHDTLIDSNFEKILRQDRSFNSLVDGLPGDWAKTNAAGGIMRLAMFLAQIGAGPDCRLSFHGIDKTAELTFDNFVQDALTFSQNIVSNSSAPLSVRQFAYSVHEGLGAITEGTEVLTEDDTTGALTPPQDNQNGYFRWLLLEGGAAEGSFKFTQVDTSGNDINTFDNRSLAGLTSVEQRMDGIYRVKAAKEIKIQKTGSIQVPLQQRELLEPITEQQDPGTDPFEGMTDDQAKIKNFSLSDEDTYYASLHFMHEEFETFEQQALFFKNLRLDAAWDFPAEDEAATKIAAQEDSPLPKMLDQDPEYQVAQLTALIQEAIELMPGRQIKLWKNSSAFVMFEDGSLTIEDGFGAGIRTEKGNLTLTAAGDIKILPGRDLITMAPRKAIHKAGDRIDISSTDKSVTIKAEEDLSLLAANSGDGALTLESRGTDSFNSGNQQNLEQGDAVGGGVVVKSKAGVSLLGEKVYVGPDNAGSENDNGLNRTAKECNIIMDAGSGTVHLAGSEGSLLFDNNLEVGHRQSSAGLYFKGSGMFLVSNQVSIVSTILNIRRGEGKITRPNVTPSGVDSRTRYGLPSGEPTVILQGSLRASGQIGAVGAISTEDRLNANQGADSEPRPRARYLSLNMPNDNPAQVRSALAGFSSSLRTVLRDHITAGLMTEKAHTYAEFHYPDSEKGYSINPVNTYFKEAKWQRLLQSPGTWDEKSVEHSILQATYPYPGKKVYDEDSQIILAKKADGTGVEKQQFSKYKTNT